MNIKQCARRRFPLRSSLFRPHLAEIAAATGFIGAPPFLFVVEASRTSLNSDLISAMCVR